MAKTFGYGMQAFAGGFATGLGLGMERKKIKMLQEEQERAEKLAKGKEENAMNWLNTNKDSLMNFQTQPQDIRNMLIFESTKYDDDWHKYLRDCENALQAGDLEELKHLNDMAEEVIKAEAEMLELGVRPENAFVGKYYTQEDMDYVKKLQMGKLPIKPIGTRMYEEEFGELPAETKEPTITDYSTGLKYLTNIVNVSPENWETAKKGLETKFGVDYSGITQEALKEAATEDKKYYSSAEEAMTTSPDIKGLSKQPVQISLNQWKVDYSKETVAKPTTTPAPTSTENIREDILDADTFKDAERIYKNYADKYDETALGITDLKQEWTDSQTSYLNTIFDTINKSIKNLIDEKGHLRKGTVTKEEIGVDFKGEQPAEEVYKLLREEYMKYRKLLEELGVDISQFPELKSLEEIEKVGFWEGFWGWGKQRGQYKSIYK